jgi:hypothetical protein
LSNAPLKQSPNKAKFKKEHHKVFFKNYITDTAQQQTGQSEADSITHRFIPLLYGGSVFC